MRTPTLTIAVLGLGLAACADRPDQIAGPGGGQAPVFASGTAPDQLADRYIVVFRPDVGDPGGLTDRLIQGYGGQVHFRYAHALRGFAATLPPQALDGIRRDPNVAYVEMDQIAYAIGDDATPGSWGLDRVDERDLPLDGNYHWDTDGSGVTAYIIDTGILTAHTEFGGRASVGYDAIGDGRNGQDCNGHGTHVSGTAGGAEYGIAKNARLVAVRVLNCQGSGSYSQVIAGVDWVTGHAQRPAVANMSLGGGFSSALNNAVTNSVAAGVTYAVAAGNDAFDACYYSPASTPAALTVGATEINDARAWFSNVGTCLDVFAPGSGIKSAWHTSTTATYTASGTSMASPHVAGVAALYLAFDPTASPAQVEGALESQATPGVVADAGSGSPNLLLYSRVTGGGSPPPPPPPPPAASAASAASAAPTTPRWGDRGALRGPGRARPAHHQTLLEGDGHAQGPRSEPSAGIRGDGVRDLGRRVFRLCELRDRAERHVQHDHRRDPQPLHLGSLRHVRPQRKWNGLRFPCRPRRRG